MQGRITFFSFTEFGAVGDGVHDDTLAIQAALDAAKDLASYSLDHPSDPQRPYQRATVLGPDGTYLFKNSLFVGANVTVICSPGCVLIAAVDSSDDYNRVIFDTVTDSAWIGGTFLRETDDLTGTIFSIKDSHRITIKDIVVRGWQKDPSTFISGWRVGRVIDANGDDIRVLNPTVRDPYKDPVTQEYEVGAGGIRVFGGRRFQCLGGTVESGDDAIALEPGPISQTSIEDATISDMSLYSRKARVLAAGLDTGNPVGPPPDPPNIVPGEWSHTTDATTPTLYKNNSLRRCRVTNIDGRSDGVTALYMRNDFSSGAIEDIEIDNMTIHCGPKIERGLFIRCEAGPVRRIRLNNVSLFVDPATTVDQEIVYVQRVDGFWWTGGRIDAPVNGANATIRLRGVVGGSLRDLSIGCRSPEGVRFTTDDPPVPGPPPVPPAERPVPDVVFRRTARDCADISIVDSVIENVPAGGVGLNFVSAVNCGAVRVRFTDGIAVTNVSTVPHGGTVTQLTAIDPAVAKPAPANEIYTVTIQNGQSSPPPPNTTPLLFTVYRPQISYPYDNAVGQGSTGTFFSQAGLNFLLEDNKDGSGPNPPHLLPGDSFTIKLQTAGGQAASLSATATACYLDGCNVSELTTTAPVIDVAAGHHHRITDLYPFDTPTNYTGGLFDADNVWSAPQRLKTLALSQASATINADTITATASVMLLTPETGTTDDLLTIDGTIAGTIIILRNATSGKTITVKDTNTGTAGNLHLAGSDFPLRTIDDTITLVRSSIASGIWFEVSRSNNGP